MYYNQSRVEKSDGQLRKSGGRSGHNRGFSGSGGRKSGGGGGTAPPHQPPSSSNQPFLSSNRSFKKSGNGQGGQSRMNPTSLGSETSAATVTSRAVQNGAHGQPPSQGSSNTPMPSGPKQGDAPVLRTSWAVLKAPSSQSAAGISDPAAPSTPVKEFLPLGDGTKPFALQFGTISPDIVNGLQIPAWTNSTPPNLDDQNRYQACHDSFRAVPTQPIPSYPKKQVPTARKDVVAVNQSTSAVSHPPVQVKRGIHQQIPPKSAAPPPKSAALPIPGLSMAMPFQQPPITMQFGGPGPQEMPISLPIGNAPKVPQEMFVHNLQSHPLQPQAMIHQGQGLGFGPQMSHQLGPQLGNLGIGIAATQYEQQQPGKFGGPRKITVKIIHPETHEELRLDKRTDSYTDGASSGQRPPNNATPQSQPIASFTPSHYFPHLQAGSYNPSPIFFPPSTSVTRGSQPPTFSYPVGAISSVPLAETPLGIGDNHRMTSGPNGYSSTPNRIPYSSREYVASRYVPDRLSESLSDQATLQGRNAYVGMRESGVTDRLFDRFTPTTVPAGRSQGSSGGSSSAVSDAKPLAEEVLREMSMSTIREFYSAKDEKEVALCIKELNSPSFYPSMVSIWVTDSFERKDMERDLLAKLLVNLCKSRDSLLSQVQLTQGFESVLSMLEDAVIDAPRAAEFLGRIFVKVILENVVPLRDIGKLIHEGGEEPGGLIESGLASDVLGSIMEIIKAEKGDSILNEILLSSKLQLGDFRPPHPIKSKKKLDPFLRGSPMSEIKGSSIDVVVISSSINEDEYQEPDDDDEDEAEESGMNRRGNGGDKKGVAGDIRPTSVEVKTGGDKGVDDDDCCILDFDPFDSTAADLKSKLSRVSSGQEEDVSVLAEKGEVACRDFPHPRHACAEFLFDKTPHESFCAQCYCYVCDASAPCAWWWKVSSPNSHCHASDQQSLWKNLRSAERLKRESNQIPK